ncbi:hypothetical protein CJ097_17185 [Salmonella enterica]|nr:hypothetical protein [Salmonella enterica]EDF5437301.1 hypothetical protein [Salmonella enterica]EDQ5069184.1 hypothetical protein [Salmonella enterica]EDT7063314.1 hypothetical protein [Salmonella enterica subsp. enterica]
MDIRWRAHSITRYSGCLLRMNACLLPTVDSDVDNRHFTHYSGYRMSRQAFYSLQWLDCIPEWCSTHRSG